MLVFVNLTIARDVLFLFTQVKQPEDADLDYEQTRQ